MGSPHPSRLRRATFPARAVREVRLVYPDRAIPFACENGIVTFELEKLEKYRSVRLLLEPEGAHGI